MKHRILWALVVVNVLLGVSLVMRFMHENTATAQVNRPSDYLLIPGEVSGGNSEVVYIVDTSNGWLGAMVYDDSSHVLNTMPPINLGRVFETTPAGANGRPPAPAR